MKHTLTFLALLAIYFISISAHTSRVTAPQQGYTSPSLMLETAQADINLSDYHGRYVLLTFWSSTDAPSRLRCNQYQQLARQEAADIALVSINLDTNSRLYAELVEYDHLDQGVNLHLSPSQRKQVESQFELNGSCKSFLIDPAGRIETINPTPDYLRSIARG